jgi:hypothetical protein
VALEGALEGGFGLIPHRLRQGPRRKSDDFLNSFAASVIRMSARRSEADRPSFSWNYLASVARDMLHRRARSGSDHARAGSLKRATTAGARRG